MDQRLNNGRRKVRSPDFVAEIAAEVEVDRGTTIQKLAAAHRVCMRMIQLTLHEDLDLSKKSARWIPKLLTCAHKEEMVLTCEEFLVMVRCHSMVMLESIVTMEESAVSFLFPETKQQSKQWTKKGQPGPIKAKVDAQGQNGQRQLHCGALSRFLAVFKKK